MSNNLLFALTSKGELRIEQFYEIFSSLCISEKVLNTIELSGFNVRSRIIRVLESLGHCEFDFEERKVFVCPPALAMLPSAGLSKAVLCGSRTPDLITELRNHVSQFSEESSFSIIPQKLYDVELPDCILIEAIDIAILEKIAKNLKIMWAANTPVAWQLINFSSSIKDLICNLKFMEESEINWPRRIFDSTSLSFSKNACGNNKRIKLVEYKNPTTKQIHHLLWRDKGCARTDRDWGRYIVLSETEKNVLLYDKKHRFLGVPSTVPLPPLLSRSLALCSGLGPFSARLSATNYSENDSGKQFMVYKNVIPQISEIISNKLNQTLIPCLVDQEKDEIQLC